MNYSYALEVFDGAMLSDAKLARHPDKSTYFAISQNGIEHLDWLKLIKSTLSALGVVVSSIYPKVFQVVNGSGKICDQWYLGTYSSPFLSDQYKRWYPDGKKRVPDDLELTPRVCSNWFIGDGCTSIYRARGNSNLVELDLCTQCFPKDDTLRLQLLLRGLGVHVFLVRRKPSFIIRTENATMVNKFLDIIKSHILPSYAYKIKRPWLRVLKTPGRHLRGPFVWREGEWVHT